MEIREILSKCDHTLLKQTSTWEEIRETLDDAVRFGTASACIPPRFVKRAKEYVGDRLPICTVIGFPNGYQTTEVKAAEAAEAVREGASEIDMVISLGDVKEGNYDRIREEIDRVKKACSGRLLKVIVETCFLTEEEKIRLCDVVSESDADYIKTSTGFGTGGATREDIALFAKHMKNEKKIKAAGGIASLKDAEAFLSLGASRLGTSRIVRIVKEQGLL